MLSRIKYGTLQYSYFGRQHRRRPFPWNGTDIRGKDGLAEEVHTGQKPGSALQTGICEKDPG
jgi:hypothetical protein